MWYFALAVILGILGFVGMRAMLASTGRRLHRAAFDAALHEVQAAREEASVLLHQAEVEAAEVADRRRAALQSEIDDRRAALAKATDRVERREQTLQRRDGLLKTRESGLKTREDGLLEIAERRKRAEAGRVQALKDAQHTLERLAEETRPGARDRLVAEWVEQARGEAKDRLRQIEANAADPEHVRQARRVLDVVSQRYEGHYLTERLMSNIPLPPGVARRAFGPDLGHLEIIGQAANVKLTLADDEAAVRLEGQDSFGREIARRAIGRFSRNPPRNTMDAVQRAVAAIAEELDRETVELGRRAFKDLEIPRAHPEIVRLVGRLNYRTSYTQNQWKHAIESAFLCGMMAAELRLDVKLARRAALMHDIGKAMTHEIDGSHAVIGADYARRLGEIELVANAIGAHHTDEPFNSPYAFIVAAADAMSGARPGARHEQADNYVQRIADLERIASSFAGIDRAYAVQAGREVRVHVKEDQVSDLQAAEMTSEIAGRISDQLVFPGQIKVTVIREVSAVAIAS